MLEPIADGLELVCKWRWIAEGGVQFSLDGSIIRCSNVENDPAGEQRIKHHLYAKATF
jgi:hypothetical protein